MGEFEVNGVHLLLLLLWANCAQRKWLTKGVYHMESWRLGSWSTLSWWYNTVKYHISLFIYTGNAVRTIYISYNGEPLFCTIVIIKLFKRSGAAQFFIRILHLRSNLQFKISIIIIITMDSYDGMCHLRRNVFY